MIVPNDRSIRIRNIEAQLAAEAADNGTTERARVLRKDLEAARAERDRYLKARR